MIYILFIAVILPILFICSGDPMVNFVLSIILHAHWIHILIIILFALLYVIIIIRHYNKPGIAFIALGILSTLFYIIINIFLKNIKLNNNTIIFIFIGLILILAGKLINKSIFYIFKNRDPTNFIGIEKAKFLFWHSGIFILFILTTTFINTIYFYCCPYFGDRANILSQPFAFQIPAPKGFGYPYSHVAKSCDNSTYYVASYHSSVLSSRVYQINNAGEIIRKLEDIIGPGLNFEQDCNSRMLYIGIDGGIAAYKDDPILPSTPIKLWKYNGMVDTIQLSNDHNFFFVRVHPKDRSVVIEAATGKILFDRYFIGHTISPIGKQGILLCNCKGKLEIYQGPAFQSEPEFVKGIADAGHWMYCVRDDISASTLATFFHTGDVIKLDDNGNKSFRYNFGVGLRYPKVDYAKRLLFVPNYITGRLFIVNIDNGKVFGPAFTGRRTRWLHISPDGKELLLSSSTGFYGFNIDSMLEALSTKTLKL